MVIYFETVKDGGECHNFFSVGMIFVMLRYFQQSPKSKSWVHPTTPAWPVIARAMGMPLTVSHTVEKLGGLYTA